jgi:hypothetical protein
MNTGTVLENLMVFGALGLVFIIVNAVFLGILYFTQRKMIAVAKWPYVMGTVKKSTTEYRSSGDGGSYYPVVNYSYQVSRQSYEGYRIAPGGEVGGVGVGKVAARYPVGAHVQVFYNSQNPSEAFLEKKAHGQFIMWIVLIIVDLGLCVFAPMMWWISR